MTVDQLIAKARHAIETGQPNLARLYMAKALTQIAARKPAKDPVSVFLAALADGVQQFIDDVYSLLTGAVLAPKATRADFAPAGPAESGGASHGS